MFPSSIFLAFLAVSTAKTSVAAPLEEAPTRDTRIFVLELENGADLEKFEARISSDGDVKVRRRFSTDTLTGLSIESHSGSTGTLGSLPGVKRAWPAGMIEIRQSEPDVIVGDDSFAELWNPHQQTGVDRAHEAGFFGKGAIVAVIDTGVDYTHEAFGGKMGPGNKVAKGYDLVGDSLTWPRTGDPAPDNDPMDHIGHGTHVAGIIAGKTDKYTGVAPEATIHAYKILAYRDETARPIRVVEDILIEAMAMAETDGADVINMSLGSANGWSQSPTAAYASSLVDKGVIVVVAAGNYGKQGPFHYSSTASGDNVLSVAALHSEAWPLVPFMLEITKDGQTKELEAGYIIADKNDTQAWEFEKIPIVPVPIMNECKVTSDDLFLNGSIAFVSAGSSDLFCTVYGKQQGLAKNFPARILFYNEDGLPLKTDLGQQQDEPDFDGNPKPRTGMVGADVGKFILEAIADGASVAATFRGNSNYRLQGHTPQGLRPWEGSNWGALNDLRMKPEVAGPGVHMWGPHVIPEFESTNHNEWAATTGTSEAAPVVAGIAALYVGATGGRKQHGDEFARDAIMRIITSGDSVPWQLQDSNTEVQDDMGFKAPVIQVGTGMVNAWKVLTYDTQLRFEKFELNDTANFQSTHLLQVINNGDSPLQYSFSLADGVGFNIAAPPRDGYLDHSIVDSQDMLNKENPVMVPYEVIPEIKMPTGTFEVGPGETKTAEFLFEMPEFGDESAYPCYSGKIMVQASNDEVLSVPYFGKPSPKQTTSQFIRDSPANASIGVGFSLQKEFSPIWESIPNGRDEILEYYPYLRGSGDYKDEKVPQTFNFDLAPGTTNFVAIGYLLKWGSRELRLDIFESGWDEKDWQYPPVFGEKGYVGSAMYFADAMAWSDWGYVDDMTDTSRVEPFPIKYLPRSKFESLAPEIWWLGNMTDGSFIQPGKYRLRFAALNPFSDPTLLESWSVFPMEEIMVESPS